MAAEAGSAPANNPLCYQGYIPGLDVLRGIAILLVLVYHGFAGRLAWHGIASWMKGWLALSEIGASGVQLFYVLSGFLISSILIDTVASRDYYRKFYVRRALRILPAYLLMLLVLKLAGVIGWRFVLAALLYIANMAGLVGARSSEYAALWSLAVEEQFYLIWPFVIRRFSLRTLTHFILGYFVFDLLLRVLYLVLLPGADTNYKLWFNAEMLLAGALVAISLRRGILTRENITRLIWMLSGLALLTWPIIVFLYTRADLSRPSGWAIAAYLLFRLPLLFTYCALLLIVLKRNRGRAEPRHFSLVERCLAFFGYISYGLYLVHQLIFTSFDRLVQGSALEVSANRPGFLLLNTAICVAISVALAYLSRRYFENLFLRQKDKIVPYQDPAINERPVPVQAVPERLIP